MAEQTRTFLSASVASLRLNSCPKNRPQKNPLIMANQLVRQIPSDAQVTSPDTRLSTPNLQVVTQAFGELNLRVDFLPEPDLLRSEEFPASLNPCDKRTVFLFNAT